MSSVAAMIVRPPRRYPIGSTDRKHRRLQTARAHIASFFARTLVSENKVNLDTGWPQTNGMQFLVATFLLGFGQWCAAGDNVRQRWRRRPPLSKILRFFTLMQSPDAFCYCPAAAVYLLSETISGSCTRQFILQVFNFISKYHFIKCSCRPLHIGYTFQNGRYSQPNLQVWYVDPSTNH